MSSLFLHSQWYGIGQLIGFVLAVIGCVIYLIVKKILDGKNERNLYGTTAQRTNQRRDSK